MGFDLQFIETHADTLKDTKDMIDHHDRQISKSFLAQFLELGVQKGGSHALSADHSKLFLLGLEYLAKIIQEELNRAIRELCELNFPGLTEDEYPTLEYGAIGEVDYEKLSQALATLAGSNLIIPTPEIEKYVLTTMKVPVSEDLDDKWDEKEAQAAALADSVQSQPLAVPKGKQPNKKMQPDTKEKVTANETLQATEFMQDIMDFHEQLEQAIAQKRTHATVS